MGTEHTIEPTSIIDVDTAIEQFNEKHGVASDGQFKALAEEMGELAETLNRDASAMELGQEIADVLFVARSIALLHDIDADSHLRYVCHQNLGKSTETDGDKVTKDAESGGERVDAGPSHAATPPTADPHGMWMAEHGGDDEEYVGEEYVVPLEERYEPDDARWRSDLDEVIRDVLRDNPNLVAAYEDVEYGSWSALMGCVNGEYDGPADIERVQQRLASALDEVTVLYDADGEPAGVVFDDIVNEDALDAARYAVASERHASETTPNDYEVTD